MEFLSALTAVMGVLMSLSYFPQAYLIFRRKSSRDVSLSTFGILGLGTFVWTIYGLVLGDLVIVLGFGVGVLGSWSVLLAALFYRRR